MLINVKEYKNKKSEPQLRKSRFGLTQKEKSGLAGRI